MESFLQITLILQKNLKEINVRIENMSKGLFNKVITDHGLKQTEFNLSIHDYLVSFSQLTENKVGGFITDHEQ